ncbi:MAG: plastocyanin/azurin family copper-binding protein [Acidimicrobiia bacterium]
MKAFRRIAAAALLMLALGTLAILPSGAQTPTDPAGAVKKVKVGDNYFKPKKVTVLVGDTVKWKWVGTAIHDVVSGKENPEKFKSKKFASGKFKHVMVLPGAYKIVCTLHPGMDMKLTVTPAPPAPTTTLAPPAP